MSGGIRPGSPGPYDIASLLRYEGPSCRVDSAICDGVEIISFRSSDENVRNLTTLLSSQGIRFFLERPEPGWTGLWPRMSLTVPADRYPEVAVLLQAAVETAVLDEIEGSEGLWSR